MMDVFRYFIIGDSTTSHAFRLRQKSHFWCECQVDTPDVVAATLLEGLSDKKPKVPPACVGILIKALQLFGARAMPLKDLKASLPGTYLPFTIWGTSGGLVETRYSSKSSVNVALHG